MQESVGQDNVGTRVQKFGDISGVTRVTVVIAPWGGE